VISTPSAAILLLEKANHCHFPRFGALTALEEVPVIKNCALGVACALALFACASPNPTGDSSQTPAQTPAPAPATAASTSASAGVSIKIRDVTITSDHFQTVDLTNAFFRAGVNGAAAMTGSQSFASNGASGDSGLSVTFSGDPACHYANGAVFQLTDPCIFLTEPGSLPQDLPLIAGVVNMCQSKILGVTGLLNGCPPGVNDVPVVTTGTLTLRRWSPSGPIEFSFSPGAQLTGIVKRPGFTDFFSAGSYDTFAVPVSGTVFAEPVLRHAN
jgi:hypothetical protein